MNNSDLEGFLASLFINQFYTVVPIESTGTNQHHCVVADNKYFLKVFQTNALQVVSRSQQFALQTELAKHKLAAQPVALSHCGRFWLEEWLESACLQSKTQKIDVELLASAMLTIHNLPVKAQTLDIQAEWLRYLTLAEQDCVQYESQIKAYFALYHDSNDMCFCHNDLHYTHVLRGDKLTILDWEYAALGNRYFDLAGCIQVNQLNVQQSHAFLVEYARLSGRSHASVAQLTSMMRPIVDFTSQLWHNAFNKVHK